jgi:Glyoxalase-like domain
LKTENRGQTLNQATARPGSVPTQFDHLVVAARTLDEGSAWIESVMGVAPIAGGKHAAMGTHNRLLKIGPLRFLEVIAVDPDAAPPARPRWFDLDAPSMRERLASGPALVHWVERTGDLDAALRDYSEPVEVLALSRGPYRWRIGVPRDGRLPGAGRLPTLIQWEGGLHPADALPGSGCTLQAFRHSSPLEAVFSTPSGVRTIRGRE